MKAQKLPMITLLLLISFASVNALLLTPALPQIASFYHLSEQMVNWVMTAYLWGYAIGQLIYGPLANRYGRKSALNTGLVIQALSCIACIVSTYTHHFSLLILARFTMALGAGVGLKMTFTLINERFESDVAAKKMAWLSLGFAFIPGLMISISGALIVLTSWSAPFYMALSYGLLMIMLCRRLPEKPIKLNKNALQFGVIVQLYRGLLKDPVLITGGIMVGCVSCFMYLYASLSPLISIQQYGMNASSYGLYNLVPTLGLVLGCLLTAKISPIIGMLRAIQWGTIQAGFAVMLMLMANYYQYPLIISLFLPMAFLNVGLSFIFANTSSFTLGQMSDKSNASALLNCINMSMAAALVNISIHIIPSLKALNLIFIIILLILLLATCMTRPAKMGAIHAELA